jgi:flagellin-like protein
MKLKQLLKEDDAVSPVIGVILMVAITVILAAVIATFVLGLGEQVSDTAPQASFTFDYDSEATGQDDYTNSDGDVTGGLLTVTHSGGPTIDAGRLSITGTSAPNSGAWSDSNAYGGSSEVAAGDQIEIYMNSDDRVRVTWTSQEGTDSATLQTYDGPDR